MRYSFASFSLRLAIILCCPTSINHYASAHQRLLCTCIVLALCTFPDFGGAMRIMASCLKWKMVQVDFIYVTGKRRYALPADTVIEIAIWNKRDQPSSATD